MSLLIEKAKYFAELKHAGQVRKYNGAPYTTHLQDVADIVASVPHTDEMVAAAWLHDVVEDTPTSLKEVEDNFGSLVAQYVEMLTDVSKPGDGNRKFRKELDRQHLAKAVPQAKTIKLADLINNSEDILGHAKTNKEAKAFAKVFIAEKNLLLEVLSEGDSTLYAKAKAIVGDTNVS